MFSFGGGYHGAAVAGKASHHAFLGLGTGQRQHQPHAVGDGDEHLQGRVAGAGEIVEATLSACAVAARDAGARRVIVAGGETSGAVTQALGVTRLDIGTEIAPGVPWTEALDARGAPICALALKSGNFGTETFFTDAQERLAS